MVRVRTVILLYQPERKKDKKRKTLQNSGKLERDSSRMHSIAQAQAASAAVPEAHFRFKPEWRRLAAGERPPAPPGNLADEPGIWSHGWQFYASAILTQHEERVVFPPMDDATRARFRSQGGPEAGAFLRATGVRTRAG